MSGSIEISKIELSRIEGRLLVDKDWWDTLTPDAKVEYVQDAYNEDCTVMWNEKVVKEQ